MKRLIPFLIFSLLLATAHAQNEDSLFIRKLADEVLTNSTAYENLRVLTKQIGGRLAGSPQMVKAEQWGLKAMQKANADSAWKQECTVPHWVRGGTDKAHAIDVPLTAGGGKRKGARGLDVVALGNSVGSIKPLTAQVLLVNSFEELEQKKDQVKGKIVFYNYKFNQKFVQTFLRYVDSFAKIPAVAIGLKDADWLSDMLQKQPTSVTLHTHGKFLPDTIGHNIIGELKGSELPDEYITVGGHLDSWDNCEGAHDDGAGCVQTMEVLRAFKALGYQPKRTIRFVLFANEENGLRGGTKYADEAKAKGEKHIFALESDAGGFTPRGFGFTVSAEQFAKVKAWESLLKAYGASDFSVGGGGADIGPLNKTQGTPMAGLQPDSQRYFDYHHARNDTFEAVNKRELDLGALNMAALIYLVDKYGL
jgi:hypothetical protein